MKNHKRKEHPLRDGRITVKTPPKFDPKLITHIQMEDVHIIYPQKLEQHFADHTERIGPYLQYLPIAFEERYSQFILTSVLYDLYFFNVDISFWERNYEIEGAKNEIPQEEAIELLRHLRILKHGVTLEKMNQLEKMKIVQDKRTVSLQSANWKGKYYQNY